LRAEPADPTRLAAIGEVARAAAPKRAATTPAVTGDGWLAEHEAKELLRAGGVNVVDGRVVHDAHDAALTLRELGGKIVLKLTGATLRHKTELGAVRLGLCSETEVAAAFEQLEPLAVRLGSAVLAERMAAPGVELIVAARSDAVVPALIVGLGGVWTEVLDDVAVVPLPAGAPQIARALRSLRGSPLLTGGRGTAPVDLVSVARMAERVGEVLLEESLELLELNPVLAGEAGAVAVDATARRRPVAARALTGALTCTT
jgi:acetate---CoA ligase (ADP-forming)